MTKKTTRNIRKYYEPRITRFGDGENYRILDWASAESQRARFKVLTDNVDLAGKTLLDVGCGLGDLLTFLAEHGIAVEYTGVDILEKMVAAARLQHPSARFIHADVFADDSVGADSFDVVFCSGTFNLNLGNNREFLPVAVRRLVELARNCAVFNLLHVRAQSADRRYFCWAPDDVADLLRTLPCTWRIIDDYLPNDFTVICRKKRSAKT